MHAIQQIRAVRGDLLAEFCFDPSQQVIFFYGPHQAPVSFPAGERLMQYYKNVAAGKVRELPFYNSSAVDYCYKMAYNWARNALRAAFLQSRKGRGREYEKVPSRVLRKFNSG